MVANLVVSLPAAWVGAVAVPVTVKLLTVVVPEKVPFVSWKVPNATTSSMSFAVAPAAKTIDDPLVAVKSAAASLTPLRYTSANPLSYAKALPDVSLPDTVVWFAVSV